MKKLLLSLFVASLTLSSNAQIKTPQPSPSAKLEQTVGLTEVKVEYSRPGVKGRKVFGNLVPYGKLWRTGANKNTIVTFSDDVTIGGKALKKGSYAIFTKPGASSWEVMFYSDTNNWGTPRKFDDSKVALTTTAKVEKMPMTIETFTITIDDVKNGSAVLGILWENVYAGIKFDVPTDKAVSASIDQVMAGPAANDYYAAASYYMDEGKDIAKAQQWIDKAVEMTNDRPRFWFLRKQSLIHAKAGDKKGAIKAAKASLMHAEKAGNEDYIKLNKDSLKEWGA
ncbi:DUF2911 domain-containing protein [uncultured Tenacibaculum sp.]|uniref:DUF2911 domain-containing protein n=1 Tax=uncultured Tenacibaculum sp. TaxID=174713 RepID=UPI002602A38B|nr:DUF2911 domain-containing protein [uncultured Tenacibaculum sp.]